MTMPIIPDNPANSLETLSDFARRDQLEPVETYRTALAAVLEVLPKPGSMVQLPKAPTIVLPDLHARREMLAAILSSRIEEGPMAGEQVFALLQQGRLNVVCLGDIVHSEKREHWIINHDGEWTPELLEQEMVRSLGAGLMVMCLKLQFPEHFHCLRGNHDDMAEEFGPFAKHVGFKTDEEWEEIVVEGKGVRTTEKCESRLVKGWVLEREGWEESFLDTWAAFERALPLFVQGTYYVMSHTLPNIPVDLNDLSDSEKLREATVQLTNNRKLNREAIESTLEKLGIKEI
jgi:hypothetical protein